MTVRTVEAGNVAVGSFLTDRGSTRVARRAELVDALQRPAVIAEDDGQLLGALTYDVVGTDFEVLTLHCSRRWAGVGTSLILEARRVATELGCNRYWLVTTNDNVDALRFYQRRGFRISEIRCGAVDAARRELKPEIPLVGEYGIALRDEIELAQQLPLSADHSP